MAWVAVTTLNVLGICAECGERGVEEAAKKNVNEKNILQRDINVKQ